MMQFFSPMPPSPPSSSFVCRCRHSCCSHIVITIVVIHASSSFARRGRHHRRSCVDITIVVVHESRPPSSSSLLSPLSPSLSSPTCHRLRGGPGQTSFSSGMSSFTSTWTTSERPSRPRMLVTGIVVRERAKYGARRNAA